jgi:putative transposase
MQKELRYYRHRFPIDVISQCVWLYFRFSLSYRDVEQMMAERGVTVSYETVRHWCDKYGRLYTKRLRKHCVTQNDDTWRLDEVYLTINGTCQYLWRAVDQDGGVIDTLVQRRKDAPAAKRFFRKILKSQCNPPRKIVTDRLASYSAAIEDMRIGALHVRDKRANNRAENSQQPTRERERRCRRFKSAKEAQRLLSTYSTICNQFRQRRHLVSADTHRELMGRRFAEWRDVYVAEV